MDDFLEGVKAKGRERYPGKIHLFLEDVNQFYESGNNDLSDGSDDDLEVDDVPVEILRSIPIIYVSKHTLLHILSISNEFENLLGRDEDDDEDAPKEITPQTSQALQQIIMSWLQKVEELVKSNEIQNAYELLVGVTRPSMEEEEWLINASGANNVLSRLSDLWVQVFSYPNSALGIDDETRDTLIDWLHTKHDAFRSRALTFPTEKLTTLNSKKTSLGPEKSSRSKTHKATTPYDRPPHTTEKGPSQDSASGTSSAVPLSVPPTQAAQVSLPLPTPTKEMIKAAGLKWSQQDIKKSQKRVVQITITQPESLESRTLVVKNSTLLMDLGQIIATAFELIDVSLFNPRTGQGGTVPNSLFRDSQGIPIGNRKYFKGTCISDRHVKLVHVLPENDAALRFLHNDVPYDIRVDAIAPDGHDEDCLLPRCVDFNSSHAFNVNAMNTVFEGERQVDLGLCSNDEPMERSIAIQQRYRLFPLRNKNGEWNCDCCGPLDWDEQAIQAVKANPKFQS